MKDEALVARVADSIYWMNRYIERAENISRFINVNVHLILDLGFEGSVSQWEALVVATGDEKAFKARYDSYSEENVIRFLTFDIENPNSIVSCVMNARENARAVREVISSEMWEHLNSYYHLIQKNQSKTLAFDLQSFFEKVKLAGHLFIGLSETTMSRGQAWHFGRLGRVLERADKTSRIMDVKYFILLPTPADVGSSIDAVQWGALLKSTSAFEMYRKRFHTINYRDVANFLIFDGDFPRSFRFCVETALYSLECIVERCHNEGTALAEIKTLKSLLDKTNVDEVLRSGLHEFVDVFQRNLNIVDRAIHDSFISRHRSGS